MTDELAGYTRHSLIETNEPRFLIGVIADEEITVGFLLAGIGESDSRSENYKNYFIVNENTKDHEIEAFYYTLTHRNDIGVILIADDIFKRLTYAISLTKKQLPILLVIPTRKTIGENVHENQTI